MISEKFQEETNILTKKRLSYDLEAETLMIENGFEDEVTKSSVESDETDGFDYPKVLRMLIDDNLTKKQKCYIILYYKEGLTVTQIAERFGVDKSTVSRTINRGRHRLAAAAGRQALGKLLG